MASGDDIAFGGGFDDYIEGTEGRDILLGDFGKILMYNDTRSPELITTLTCSFGGDDTLKGGNGTKNYLIGGSYNDTIYGGDGEDFAFGDHGIIRLDPEYKLSSAETIEPDCTGGDDTIIMASGDDVAFGGGYDDYMEGNGGRDILLGDFGKILYYDNFTSPELISTLNCSFGGDDILKGGPGTVNYLIGGSYNDTIYGDDGEDLAFGDHAVISFYTESHKLRSAETIDAECTGGNDEIYLHSGDDIAFGGGADDYIEGNNGQDILLGDFGKFNTAVEFLPYQNYQSFIDYPRFAGSDTIRGGDGDDFIMGQEKYDDIDGEGGRDDIYGGHNIRFGEDSGDLLMGGEDGDAILGENGEIIRERISFFSSYPWIRGVKWEYYPAPFDSEVTRKTRRYDDIDYVQGNDEIHGGDGNDILHGQRGNDTIFGDAGEDELYGELGDDTLNGGEGNDILIGDIGYAVRRFNDTGSPREIANVPSSRKYWHKDIVLEELGNITGVSTISKKMGESTTAEDVMKCSMWMVANAVNYDGSKFLEGEQWPTDLLCFDVVKGYHDELYGDGGDDILIGQRGDDTLLGGSGSDILIGDAGSNTATPDIDMPKIHQVYRTLSNPSGSIYERADDPDFGVVFTADYELYPNQYRQVDSQASIIDSVVNVDNIEKMSDLVRDVLGVSALATTNGYFMQPMFRVTPGFLVDTQHIHGSDTLISGNGNNILIGDDIRGFTGLDLTELSPISNVLQRMDRLIVDLSVRLSTLEVDTELFESGGQVEEDLRIGCDTITTHVNGTTFSSGDSLILIERTILGGSLDQQNATIQKILERMHDIELVLVDLHASMFELHTNLLRRSITEKETIPNQVSKHNFSLADDTFNTLGDFDIVVGDSVTLFIQVDRPGKIGFEFDGADVSGLRPVLRAITSRRDQELDDHVQNLLDLSTPLSSQEKSSVPFWDIPYLASIGTDEISMYKARNLAVGDFAVFGLVISDANVTDPNVLRNLTKYAESVEDVRFPPSMKSLKPQLNVFGYKMGFYTKRYDSETSKIVVPKLHGDTFYGHDPANVIVGEFTTACGFQTNSVESVLIDNRANAYGRYQNAEFSQMFSEDTFTVAPGTVVNVQKGSEKIDTTLTEGVRRLQNSDEFPEIAAITENLFVHHSIVRQMVQDLYSSGEIPSSDLLTLKNATVAVSPEYSSFIPEVQPLEQDIPATGANRAFFPSTVAPTSAKFTPAPTPVTSTVAAETLTPDNSSLAPTPAKSTSAPTSGASTPAPTPGASTPAPTNKSPDVVKNDGARARTCPTTCSQNSECCSNKCKKGRCIGNNKEKIRYLRSSVE